MLQLLKRCLHDVRGATVLEYGFIALLLSIAAIVAIGGIGMEVESMISQAGDGFPKN